MLHTVMHLAHTSFGENAIISARGHHLQCPMMEPFVMSSRSRWVVEEDVSGGFWFAPTDIFRLLFRDRPLSFVTSEDSMLCAALRKYTGKSCLVAPIDPNDENTTTQDLVFDLRAREGDTTMTTNKMPERTRVTRELFRRGTPIKRREKVRQTPAVLLVVDACWTADILSDVAVAHIRQGGRNSWFVALTGACSEEHSLRAFPSG